jgi:ubiquinone/menaquinone biosynthesis C-methylase UbiE
MDPLYSAADIFNKHAQLYASRFMDVSLYADELTRFCTQIPNGGKVLELACGPGNITRYLLELRPDLKILATDIAPNMLELAKANCPGAEFHLLDCRDMSAITETYDGILCGFCLPYLSDEESAKLIRNCAAILKPEGSLYLSCMEEGEHCQSGIKTNSAGDKTYMYYHRAGFLSKALSDAGFHNIELNRKISPAGNEPESTDLIFTARKAGIVFE